MNITRLISLLMAGMLAIGASSAASAGGVHLGVNIGVPAPVYVAPAPVYAPPPPASVVYQATPVVVAPTIYIGWHGDRYWDGHRYWGRSEWNRYHGRGNPGHWH
jgi:hypothetical protein